MSTKARRASRKAAKTTTPKEAATLLVNHIEADGLIAVPVVIRLSPSELTLATRRALEFGEAVDAVIQGVAIASLQEQGELIEALREYEPNCL